MWKLQLPPDKSHPHLSQQPPSKSWGLVKHPPPLFFKFGWTFNPPAERGCTLCPNNPENQILKKWKNPEDIIILNKCTINDNHIMYSSWDMKCDRILCHFDPFLLFYPTNNPKKQNLKKMKRRLEISPFYTSVPKIMIICYNVPETWHLRNVITIFHFGPFFALLHPNCPKNQN